MYNSRSGQSLLPSYLLVFCLVSAGRIGGYKVIIANLQYERIKLTKVVMWLAEHYRWLSDLHSYTHFYWTV